MDNGATKTYQSEIAEASHDFEKEQREFHQELLKTVKEQNDFVNKAHFAIELTFLFVLIALVIIAI